jgi:predicted transcriptional regulator
MGTTKTNQYTAEQLELAAIAKALAHPARIAILQHVLQVQQCVNGELVKEIGLAQATVSQHLKELKQLGILQGTVEGTSMSYCINPEAWSKANNLFSQFFGQFNEPPSCC